MQNTHHYSGLTDAQVLENREKYGVNILTPPKEETFWEKVKNCKHFWLIKAIGVLLVLAVAAILILPLFNKTLPNNVWVGPIILAVLFVLT